MTHQYTIEGMTCNGCVAKVKSALLKMVDVLSADVSLSPPQASISMSKHIPVSSLQKALDAAGHYSIHEMAGSVPQGMSDMNQTEESASYYPIYLIFGYIAAFSGIAAWTQETGWQTWMRYFMGGFFAVFSFFKLLNLRGFADGYATYDWIAKTVYSWGFVYPFLELGLAFLYFSGLVPIGTNLVTLALMSVSVGGVIQSLLKKQQIQCACLGTIIKLPLSRVTLFEDLLMIVMSAIMLLIGIA